MPRVLICYYSKTGNTEAMAYKIADGVREAGADVDMKKVSETKQSDLVNYDGIVYGSPTYFGGCAGELKSFIDKCEPIYEQLEGKVGGAFTSSDAIAGGNETTIMQIVQVHMMCGMVVTGDTEGEPYGPVSIGKPDAEVEKNCVLYGKRIANLVKKLHG